VVTLATSPRTSPPEDATTSATTRSHRGRGAVVLLAALAAATLGISACSSSSSGGDSSSSAAAGSSSAASSGTSSSASSAAASSGSGQIALLLPENTTTRYEQQDRPNFTKKVTELCPKCTVLYENAENDASKQQQQIEAAVTKGVKVMVLDAVDTQAVSSTVAQAEAEGVKVISYGRLVANVPLSYFVSIDPLKGGEVQAQSLLTDLKSKGVAKPKIVMINGSPTDSNAAPFKKGALQVFNAAGVDIVKQYDTPDWDPATAQTEMQQAITALGPTGFDAVYVANDGMAGGVVAALKGASIDPSTKPTTGQDAELSAIQRIVAGQQYMTLYTPLIQVADSAAEYAVDLQTGKTPPALKDTVNNGKVDVPTIYIPTVAVTKANLKSTIIADKFATPAQICTSSYASACTAMGLS
jgi:D-xylose transport system substrate-binding protein